MAKGTKRQPITEEQFVQRLKDQLWIMANVGSENPLCSVVKAEADKRANELLIEALLIRRMPFQKLRAHIYELELRTESEPSDG